MPKFTSKHEYISLQANFVSQFMPAANATFVKVYLYGIYLSQNSMDISNAQIANTLSILESDVLQAFTYWVDQGILKVDGDTVEFVDCPAQNTPPAKSTVTHTTNYPVSDIADAIENDKTLADMYTLAQEVLGKTLSPPEMQTLYWFYDELSMPQEVILMLLEYCVSKEKRNMNYIEKVAISWSEKGITTMEAVGEFMHNETQRFYPLRKVLGIVDRKLSNTEEDFLKKWMDTFDMSEEMIALAYEHCIIQTSKLSFPYMDKIMERWAKSGIHTIDEAIKDDEKFKKTSNSQGQKGYDVYKDTYDHDELETLIRNKLT